MNEESKFTEKDIIDIREYIYSVILKHNIITSYYLFKKLGRTGALYSHNLYIDNMLYSRNTGTIHSFKYMEPLTIEHIRSYLKLKVFI